MTKKPLVIDGSQGEGGGQILRTSVALAAALGLDVRLTNIRAKRPKPGLGQQHLAAVRAAAAVCSGELTGDSLGSQTLTFRPGNVAAGQHSFEIPTAGSTILLLQTVIPALTLARGESQVAVTGGTHNPFAPCFEYLRDVFAPLASAANVQTYFEMERAGFYPAGGGRISMQIRGAVGRENLSPFGFSSRGELRYIEGVSGRSNSLPADIAERQAQQALGRLAAAGHKATLEQAGWDARSPGTVVFLRAVFAKAVAGFFALGKKGRPAYRVADEAVDALLAFLDSDGAVDAHAADQLLPIAAMCPGESRFRTECITSHLLTVADVVRQLTGREVAIDGRRGEPANVRVRGNC
ncbi:MAG: RNA 3'-terminal phosphate cyclase [Planctomycetota bacterium]